MRLRDLAKMLGINDGTRTLMESVFVPEVAQALSDWKRGTGAELKAVLIGGLALSFYSKPRYTQDIDFLFLEMGDIPHSVSGFKKTRPGAFQHSSTHVEIEVVTPKSINMSNELALAIYDEAIFDGGVKVASPSGLVAAKLLRFSLQDQADIAELINHEKIDLRPFKLDKESLKRYKALLKRIGP